MMIFKLIKFIVPAALLAEFFQQLIQIIILLGFFSHNHDHYPGQCEKIANMQFGSEDFHTLPNGLTFITSGFRLQHMSSRVDAHFRNKNITGHVYLFDFNHPENGVEALRILPSANFNISYFHPHGISVLEDTLDGRHTLFVVNHPAGDSMTERIEKFVFNPESKQIIHQQYFASSKMKIVNDVQALGPNSFYFTNYQYFSSPPLVMIERFMRLAITDIVYFDGKDYVVVADGMASLNGIAMSADGRFVYVAVSLRGEIHVFERNQNTNRLTLFQIYAIHTIPDNIEMDHKYGDIYVGCHPSGYKLLQHLHDPNVSTPSQILQLHIKDGKITSSQELLFDEGGLISGSTSAIIHAGKLLVGSIFNNLIICDVCIPM